MNLKRYEIETIKYKKEGLWKQKDKRYGKTYKQTQVRKKIEIIERNIQYKKEVKQKQTSTKRKEEETKNT